MGGLQVNKGVFSVLPLIFFGILVAAVGFFVVRGAPPLPTPTPSPTQTPTNLPVASRASLTAFSTPTMHIPTDTPTPPPIATNTPTATRRPSLTPSPTASPTATDTPTLSPTPTATPSITPTPLPEAVVVARELNLRAGPGTVYAAIALLKSGDTLDVLGRIGSNEWVQVAPVTTDTLGWVAAAQDYVTIYVDLKAVPVVTPPPLPVTPTPTVTPTPKIYPAPLLLSPENGSGALRTFPALKWNWSGILAEDEYFEVRIWHESAPYPISYGWVKQPQFDYNLGQGEQAGKYFWSVIIVKDAAVRFKDWYEANKNNWPYPVWEHDPAQADKSIYLSQVIEPRHFMFTPGEEKRCTGGGCR